MHRANVAAMFSYFLFHFIFVPQQTADMTNEEFLEYWLILPWGNDTSEI